MFAAPELRALLLVTVPRVRVDLLGVLWGVGSSMVCSFPCGRAPLVLHIVGARQSTSFTYQDTPHLRRLTSNGAISITVTVLSHGEQETVALFYRTMIMPS